MIRALSFGITYTFVRFLSLFPFWFLNGMGYILYQILDKILHYRRKIILKNLRNAFPEKSEKEIRSIKSDFYRYFSRLMIENIKMFHLSLSQLESYIRLKNPELIRDYFTRGISVAAIAAHYGNWEWLLGLKRDIPHHSIGVFKSLNNKYFNGFFTRHRSMYRTEIINMRQIPRVLLDYKAKGTSTLTVYIADQSPVWEEIQYWTTFLNQQTPVYLGPEKLARKFQMAVVYIRIRVMESNKYEVEFVPICENAAEMQEYEITEKHLELLENDIRNDPQYWLWSHRRWKLTEKRKKLEQKGIYRFEGKIRK